MFEEEALPWRCWTGELAGVVTLEALRGQRPREVRSDHENFKPDSFLWRLWKQKMLHKYNNERKKKRKKKWHSPNSCISCSCPDSSSTQRKGHSGPFLRALAPSDSDQDQSLLIMWLPRHSLRVVNISKSRVVEPCHISALRTLINTKSACVSRRSDARYSNRCDLTSVTLKCLWINLTCIVLSLLFALMSILPNQMWGWHPLCSRQYVHT